MTDWTLNVSPQLESEAVQCMQSNDDRTALGEWETQELVGKAWSLRLNNFWQETDEGASPKIDPVLIGSRQYVILYPRTKDNLAIAYQGYCEVANVGVPANVGGKIRQEVELTGNGDLFKYQVGVETPPSKVGVFPPQSTTEGEAVNLDVSPYFSGPNLTYSEINLPAGLSLNTASGVITGTVNQGAASQSVTITATNGGGSAQHVFQWNVTEGLWTIANATLSTIAGTRLTEINPATL